MWVEMKQSGDMLGAELTGPAKQGKEHPCREAGIQGPAMNTPTYRPLSGYKKEVKSQSLFPM